MLTRFWKSWIEHRERAGNRRYEPRLPERPLDWGLSHLGLGDRDDPGTAVKEFNRRSLESSHEYFCPGLRSTEDFTVLGDRVTFPSAIQSFCESNNKVTCRRYPRDSQTAVIVVPFWNASAREMHSLCKLLQLSGHSTLLMSLPYHDERMPDGYDIAYHMVSSNIGLTLQAMRQAVQDILSCVDFLVSIGHERIAVVGSSIGSCAGFLAAAHDTRISLVVNNLMSSYFGDVVWTGIATQHIRRGLEKCGVTREQLHDLWMLNSPSAFVDVAGRRTPPLRSLVVSGKYDPVFIPDLTSIVMKDYVEARLRHSHCVFPCGHFSLGEVPFNLLDGAAIWNFLRREL